MMLTLGEKKLAWVDHGIHSAWVFKGEDMFDYQLMCHIFSFRFSFLVPYHTGRQTHKSTNHENKTLNREKTLKLSKKNISPVHRNRQTHWIIGHCQTGTK